MRGVRQVHQALKLAETCDRESAAGPIVAASPRISSTWRSLRRRSAGRASTSASPGRVSSTRIEDDRVRASQVIAEEQQALDLVAARREDVEVDVRVRAVEETMFVPVAFSDAQHITGGLERGEIPASSLESATARTMSILGLAARCGTDVEPTCSSSSTRSPRVVRMRATRARTATATPGRTRPGDRSVERLERPDAHRGQFLVAAQARLVHSETLGPPNE